MSIVIKSCRNLLLLLFFVNCNNNGEPVALSVFYDSIAARPIVLFKCDPGTYEKNGNSWDELFCLYKIENGKPASNKVIAEVTYNNDTLFLKPVFQPDAEAEFEAIVIIQRDTIRKRFKTPPISSSMPVASVQHIFPTSSEIPENILMFHVVFDQPMKEDPMAYENIKLIDEKGEEKQMVWRQKSNWTSDGKHLIMMIHPGWVKRDIHYLDEYGPEFKPGKKYKLIVTTQLKDRYNRSISQEYIKEFAIVKADRQIPSIDKSIVQVRSGTQDSLELYFSEALDYGSALIGINVIDEKGNRVEGSNIPITDNHWAFVPKNNWEKKQYSLELIQNLTDIASNNFNRRFEEQDIELMKPYPPIKSVFIPN